MTTEKAIRMIDEYLAEPNSVYKDWVEVLILCRQVLMENDRQKAEIERYLHSIRLLEEDVKAVESARKNERLLRMVAEEREKVAGHEQIAKVHSAYISILLRKLGVTKDNMITIQSSEVKEAINKYEARAMPAKDSWSLYCEVIEE